MYDNGVFQGKRALLSVTTGGGTEHYEKGGFNGDIHGILRPIQGGIFEFVGFSVLTPHIVYGPAHMTEPERKAALTSYVCRLSSIVEEAAYPVGAY
jgi:NAD(P)H dehydrogenase (quinone)